MAESTENIHRGGCFCGAISYEVSGRPMLSAYCHCTLCQRLNSSAFIHTIHFSAAAFSWTYPEPHEEALDSYSVFTKPWKIRKRCKKCGSTVASYNTKLDKWSVWGGQLERDADGKIKGWDSVKPEAHMFYETRMLDISDNLKKWTGYPEKSERILG
ncbi:Mss4-like protein [Cyathus striatus]|nr:Mss4-like protein [Cyathus striatus]